jgi:branched-subunit amino acid aminotransferase/4-amino-4-deoxychorismate lyase
MRTPFPQGSGIFETLRTENGQVAELTRHMRRAVTSARKIGIAIPDEEELRIAMAEEIDKSAHEVGRLRLCFSSTGYEITHHAYQDATLPLRLTFHSTSSQSVGEQIKSYPYDLRFAILDEALLHGFDDAIVFNLSNHVTESAIANIAFLLQGRWITPPISAGILPGVMRAIAVERCEVLVSNIHIEDIAQCQGAILLNSLKVAAPVSHIGEFQLPDLSDSMKISDQIRKTLQFTALR